MSRKDDLDNHANQLNSNNDAYWQSRDFDDRPENWEDRLNDEAVIPSSGTPSGTPNKP